MDQVRPNPAPSIQPAVKPASLGPDSAGVEIAMPVPTAKPPNASGSPESGTKIRGFEQRLGAKHEDKWDRTPNRTGTGAIHVKSFHCKLNDESLHFLDQQVNEWLDKNPQYEVKLVTTTIGEWAGKIKEQNLIVQVWV